jgi:hypothetical protein
VRVLHQPLLGCRNADRGQQFNAAHFRGRAVELEMLLQRLDQLGADGQYRIERGHRILKHHRQRTAAQLAQAFAVEAHEILAVEHHAAGQFCLFRQQLQDRP